MDENKIHFSGSIPENYDKYLGPIYFEPYAIDMASRFDPSTVEMALEIGSGTGRVTRQLRRSLDANAKLIASDLSEDMLNVARKELKGLDIEWQIIDAQSLPFEDNTFDLVVSCFAWMFVEDKAKAYSEVYRTLKPGGLFLLATWDSLESNGASEVFRKTVKKYFQDTLPKMYGLPFVYNDHDEIKGHLEDAGFTSVRIEQVKKPARADNARNAAIGLTQGSSLYNEIINHDPSWVDKIIDDVTEELSARYGHEPMIAPMSAVFAEGRK